ncbi:DUF6452 family protein [Maribacter cobaltidurans]|uniref:Uncharacterized protein n=1 Tax=Maribacter cobaltidurans TaxID=1178778 RepID=A0A223V0X1_9FLAO|nr:DUF6452 family protein [Maribacter cobaltidurans]ASV28952.1 hypothetical protein CJ263_01170 [Maribacter cobaltidurans]GGD73400.1 hypothetical protein GCM10011412_08840 [Maribacter cobaltidurans]
MRKLNRVIFTFLLTITLTSCEKDDICVEGNTPLLVLEFFNVADTTAVKNVTALRIVGEGQTVTVNTFTDRSNLSSVAIPLRTEENSTTFYLISNSASNDNGQETGNIDTLTFNYDRIEDFKSRACGFVVNYDNVSTELQTGSGNWIADIEVIRASVTNSDSTHVKIFH